MVAALLKIPKLGRKKIVLDGRPYGRNELIAKYIYLATKKTRSRKQVSSHIQVMKKKMIDHPDCEYQAPDSYSVLVKLISLVNSLFGIEKPNNGFEENCINLPVIQLLNKRLGQGAGHGGFAVLRRYRPEVS